MSRSSRARPPANSAVADTPDAGRDGTGGIGPYRNTLAIGLILLAASLPFLPTLQGGFLNWDDDRNLVQNEAYRGLSPGHLRWMFTTAHHGGYYPVAWVSFGVDFTLWGMDPRGYHATNLLLHAVNGVLLLLLLRELLQACGYRRGPAVHWSATFATLVFVTHPLRVESVAWITERRGLLAALFALLAVLFYLKRHRPGTSTGRRRALLAASAGAFLLSLLSKGIAITLPLVLLVADLWPLRRLEKVSGRVRGLGRLVLEKTPYLAAALIIGVLARFAQAEGGTLRSLSEHPLLDRFAQAAYGACFYLWKTVIPADLGPLHPLDRKLDPGADRFILSIMVVLVLTVAVWLGRRRRPGLAAAWAAYLIVLAPVLGFVQSGPQLVAERYSYLATIPAFGLLSGLLLPSPGRPSTQGRFRMRPAAAAFLAVAFGVVSWNQCGFWTNSTSLWRRAAEQYPRSPTVNLQMGDALEDAGRHEAAVRSFAACVMNAPHYAEGWFRLGRACFKAGMYQRARKAWMEAHRLAPGEAHIRYCLALLYHEGFKEHESALLWCRRTLAVDAGYSRAYHLAARIHLSRGDRERAIDSLKACLEASPGDKEAKRRLREIRRE